MSSNDDRVLQLGRDLADALDPSDVIGRWMSHHLAELITQCEQNPDDRELSATTRDVVLKLWEHKSGAHFQTDPYRYLQPLLRAIARLEPNTAPWTFYNPFDEETPSVGSLSTYPLLRTALDIDREAGNLIRLCVGTAAQEAISCEEPWVIAGKEIARTEEDRAVRTLERAIRRMRLQTQPSPHDAPNAQNETDDEPGLTIPAEPAADEQVTAEPLSSDENGINTEETFESVDSLTLALQSAIVRCRRLLDQLGDQHVVAASEAESPQLGHLTRLRTNANPSTHRR